MDFAFDDAQEELRRTVRAFLEETAPEAETRRVMETAAGYDPALWRRMGTELGLQGLAIPERHGGAGAGPVEVGLVMEEMGRALLCAPYLASAVQATTTLLHGDDEEARSDLLPGLASGDRVATLALTEDTARWDREGVALTARPQEDGGWLLNGHKTFVLDGAQADVILTIAETPGGIGIFRVDGGAPGLIRTALTTLDPTRRQARLEYRDVPARRLRTAGDAWGLVELVLHHSAAALAAEQVGVASRALETAVEYAKVRHQFGRAIGSFQAVKHLLADVLMEVESARAAAYAALLSAQQGGTDLPAMASLAKSFCSDACLQATQGSIQVHGGIGFTWEHPAHLYFKRAKTSQLLLGDPAHHRELLARTIGV
ncbi:acyl-CoA dehydrogenase family protein [Actinomadura vinacea]|uniref:Acyl-CoA dehydrogenase family protein n=1 Tax=Actinomadura vinacea TaxID=115336 RepID=A0ABP5VUB9_9ACTN